MLGGYVEAMVRHTDQITAAWTNHRPVDMLVEMRKISLLILMETLFNVDYTLEVQRLWDSVIRLMKYISPGLWLIWRDAPRPGYAHARAEMDAYWFDLIHKRRQAGATGNDMLSLLIAGGMSDELIRDQLMTMLTAGHDTSTAMLSWAMVLLGNHPEIQAKAREEIRSVLGDTPPVSENIMHLPYLEQIINETLRLYPPAHLGSRIATSDLEFKGYHIPAGTRVLYSIYLTHRHPAFWDRPDDFIPERFAPENKGEHPRPHYAYVPFGGGPRICIGMAFAQVEMRVVLARILQRFTLGKPAGSIYMRMGAALEPRPGVTIQPTTAF
jgi:cytochrome P450